MSAAATVSALDADDDSRLSALSIAQQGAACEASPIAIVHLSVDRRLLRFNDAFASFVGRSRDYLANRPVDELLFVDDAERERADIDTLLDGSVEITRAERRYLHASGRRAWAEVESVAVRHADRSTDFICMTLIDIGERKFLERRLGSLAAVIEQTSDFVAIFDKSLNVQYVNAAGLRLLGLPSREALDRLARPNMLDWVWEDDLPLVRDIAIPSIEATGSWNGRLRYRHARTGLPIETVFNVSAIRDDSGRVTAYSTISPDLQKIVAAERALRATSSELAVANRQKDKVLARLGHELRNPMNALVNGLDVLAAAGSDAEHAAMLSMMKRQAGQLNALISDLSDVARARSGQLNVEPRSIRMDRFVEEVVTERRFETAPLGIRLETSTEQASGAFASIDDNRIRQVLNNLIGNAIRAIAGTSRSGRIQVSLACTDDHVIVDVTDNGRGIEPHNLERIFEPFERVAGDRSDGGLGLGLAIARELAHRHEGTLSARSDGAGLGATFRLTLPRPADAALLDEAATSADALDELPGEPDTEPEGSGRQRIVLIDDALDASDAMRRVLERFGHETHRAPDGATGIALALEVQPDIVICDIGMPGMDGFEVARRLRQRALFDDTRLIALTGFADERTAREAKAAGFSEHVAKPISGRALKALIAQAAN